MMMMMMMMMMMNMTMMMMNMTMMGNGHTPNVKTTGVSYTIYDDGYKYS